MTKTTGPIDDEINGATGYAEGDTFDSEQQVRDYFTIENVRDMFNWGKPFGGEPAAEQLDEWAEWVIANRSHMKPQKGE